MFMWICLYVLSPQEYGGGEWGGEGGGELRRANASIAGGPWHSFLPVFFFFFFFFFLRSVRTGIFFREGVACLEFGEGDVIM